MLCQLVQIDKTTILKILSLLIVVYVQYVLHFTCLFSLVSQYSLIQHKARCRLVTLLYVIWILFFLLGWQRRHVLGKHLKYRMYF